MQLPSPNLGRIKTILHGLQGFVIFLAWAFTIAVFTREGKTDGRTGWFFGMVYTLDIFFFFFFFFTQF